MLIRARRPSTVIVISLRPANSLRLSPPLPFRRERIEVRGSSIVATRSTVGKPSPYSLPCEGRGEIRLDANYQNHAGNLTCAVGRMLTSVHDFHFATTGDDVRWRAGGRSITADYGRGITGRRDSRRNQLLRKP